MDLDWNHGEFGASIDGLLAPEPTPTQLLECCHLLREALPPAPGPDHDAALAQIVARGAVPVLVSCLVPSSFGNDVQRRLPCEAAWVVTQLAAAKAPCAALLAANALPSLVQLLAQGNLEEQCQACWALANLSGVDAGARASALNSSELIDAVAHLLSAEPSQLNTRKPAQSPPHAAPETAGVSAPPTTAEPSADTAPAMTTTAAAAATAATSGPELQRLAAWLASNLCRGTVEASGANGNNGTPPHAQTQKLLPGLLLVLKRHALALEEERGSTSEGIGDASAAAATEACWAVNFFLAESESEDASPEEDGAGSAASGSSREGEGSGEDALGSASERAGFVLASGLAVHLIEILDFDAHSGWGTASTNPLTAAPNGSNTRAGLRAAALRALASLALAATETQAGEIVGLGALKAANSLLIAALASRESRRAAQAVSRLPPSASEGSGDTTTASLLGQDITTTSHQRDEDDDDEDDDEMAAAVRASLGLPVEELPRGSAGTSHAATVEGEGNGQSDSSPSTGSLGEEEVAKETAWLVSNLATAGMPLAQAVCDTPGLLANLIAVASSSPPLARSEDTGGDGVAGARATGPAAINSSSTSMNNSSNSGGSRRGAALEALWALCNVAMHGQPSQLVALMHAGAAKCFVGAIDGAAPSVLDAGSSDTAASAAAAATTAATEAAAPGQGGDDDDSASSLLASASTLTLGLTGLRGLVTHAATLTPSSTTNSESSSTAGRSSSASDPTIGGDHDPLVLLRNHQSALEAVEAVSAFLDEEEDEGDSEAARESDEGAASDQPASSRGTAAGSTRLSRAFKGAAEAASSLLDAYAVALSQRPDLEDGDEEDDDDGEHSESEDGPNGSNEAEDTTSTSEANGGSSEATGRTAPATGASAAATTGEAGETSASSSSTTEGTFFVSVPNAAELPSEIFLEMTEELVTNALGAPGLPGHAEGFTWPERGWALKQSFLAEFRAGIHHGSSSAAAGGAAAGGATDAPENALPRGVVARGLSRDEADGLVAKLGANGLPADVHVASSAQSAPPGVLPPPQLFTVSHGDALPPRPVRHSASSSSRGGGGGGGRDDDDRLASSGSGRGLAGSAARAYMRRRGLEGFAHTFGELHDDGDEDDDTPHLEDPDLGLLSSLSSGGLTGRDAWVNLPRPPTGQSGRSAALEAALAAQQAAMMGDLGDDPSSQRGEASEFGSRRARTAAASRLRQHESSGAAARTAAATSAFDSLSDYASARTAAMAATSSSSPSASLGESKGDGESGDVYNLAPGECGFDLTQGRAAKFRFTNGNRTAHSPMGPILLLSSAPQPPASATPAASSATVATGAAAASASPSATAAAAAKKDHAATASRAPPASSSSAPASSPVSAVAAHTMRWRVKVSGNSSWSLGVVSATPPPHAADPASPSGRYSGRATTASPPPPPSLMRRMGDGDYGSSSSGGRTSPRSDALQRGGRSGDRDSTVADAEMEGVSTDDASSSLVVAWNQFPDYLAQRGRVGITSTNDKLQKLQSLDGKIVDVLVDLRRRVATFSVHALSPYTVAQPLYEALPVRLACSGYNGTVFSLLPFPEDEIAYAAVEQAVQNLAEGRPTVPPDSAAADKGVAYAVYTAPGPSASGHQMLRATEDNDADDLFSALVAGRRSRLVSAAALAGNSGKGGGEGDGSGGQNSGGGVKIEGGATISPEGLVGKRVRVKWAGNRHFPGRISDYDPDEDKHTVCYDDGDVRQYRLQDKKFFLLPQQPTQPSTPAAADGAAAVAETGRSASSQAASATQAPAGLAAYLLGRTSGSSSTAATGASTAAECHPTPNGARVGLRYTFEPTSRHAYHPRFQSGTIVRLLAFNHQRPASPLASEEALLDPNRGGSAGMDGGPSEGMGESGVATALATEESPELASATGAEAGSEAGAAGSGDDSGASGARSLVPPLRVQWDVTGLEADCHYEDLELIVPEDVAANEAAASSTTAADASSTAEATPSLTPAAADASTEGSNVAETATAGTGGDKATQTQDDGNEKKLPQGSSPVAPKTGQEKEEKGLLLVTVATCAAASTEPGESMLRVERSNWWSYGDQDGGAGSIGALLAYTDQEGVLHDKSSSDGNVRFGGHDLQRVAMPPLHALVKWPATSPLPPPVPPPADAGSSGAATPSPTPMNAGHGATPNVATAEYVDVYPIGHRGKFALQVHTPERAEFLAAAAQARREAAAKQITAKADTNGAAALGPAGAGASAGADSAEAAAAKAAAAAAAAGKKDTEARSLKETRVPRAWEVCLDHGWRPLPSDVAAVLENLYQRLKGSASRSRRAESGREDASSSGSSSSSGSGGAGTAHLAEMGGTSYLLDVSHMTQRNVLTGTRRALRRAPKPPSRDTKTSTSQAGGSSSSGRKSSSSSSRRQQERASSRGHGKHAASQEATISPELVVAADGNALEGSDDALLGALPSYFLLMSHGQ